MKTFSVNGKRYNAKPFDFNMVCDLEDMGVDITSSSKMKILNMARSYFAICAGMDAEEAGNEIGQHMISGGSLEEVIDAMSYEMENSDFFRNLNKTTEEETPKVQKKTSKAQ